MSYDGEVYEDDWCIAHACMKSRWVDGRLRRVRGDGTLGTTCVHGVGLTGGLWCGACNTHPDRTDHPAEGEA